ncbi:hypothetical protein JL721_1430 [Aureococcus anophagefferens]|nr:hypothetical protein JL721_1430 [Aureococcus anophagefferens]
MDVIEILSDDDDAPAPVRAEIDEEEDSQEVCFLSTTPAPRKASPELRRAAGGGVRRAVAVRRAAERDDAEEDVVEVVNPDELSGKARTPCSSRCSRRSRRWRGSPYCGSENPCRERYLFHGAAPATIDKILDDGVDFRLSQITGAMGACAYFADQSSYSDQYCRMPDHSAEATAARGRGGPRGRRTRPAA